jgi:hypothetical protein
LPLSLLQGNEWARRSLLFKAAEKQLAARNNPFALMKRKGIQVALDKVFGNIQCQDKISSKPVELAPTTGGILFGNGAFQGVIKPFHPGRATIKRKGKKRKKARRGRRRQWRRKEEKEAPTPMDWEPVGGA